MVLILENFDSILDKTTIKSKHIETEAYIKSILKRFIINPINLQSKSVVLMFSEAKNKCSFADFQDIGDYIFFTRTMFPESIPCDIEFYSSIGKNSYHECYKYLNGAWPLYEELSIDFNKLSSLARKAVDTKFVMLKK